MQKMNEKQQSEPDTAEFLLYQTEDGQTRLEVAFRGETCWLSLNQLAELFQRDKSVISRHIKNIFDEGELAHEATVAKFATVQIYSDEGNEPPHIHVEKPNGECKFWLEPIRLARNKGVSPQNIRQIERIIFEYHDFLEEKFHGYFSHEK